MEVPPVTVEGDWTPAQSHSVRNKLQLYFQSKKRSNGGECRVELEEGRPRAAVYFKAAEVRDLVLAKKNHEIVLGNKTLKLRLIHPAESDNSKTSVRSDGAAPPPSSTDPSVLLIEPITPSMSHDLLSMLVESASGSDESGFSLEILWESGRAVVTFKNPKDAEQMLSVSLSHSKLLKHGLRVEAVEAADSVRVEELPPNISTDPSVLLIEPITPSMSPDLLSMLVESASGSDESGFSLEVLWESGKAVVTFKNPKDAEQMLSVSLSHSKLLKHGLRVETVEAADSVRVEGLPSHVSTDILEIYCENHWTHPLDIKLFPEEEAAIVTFSDSKVVESICVMKDHMMRSVPIRIYPYHRSLETALYGAERPQWKLPAPITDKVHHVVWEYLQKKKLSGSINEQMRPHFCSVDLEEPEVKIRPLPGLLRQKNVTTQLIEAWPEDAQKAFHHVMSQFSMFECVINEMAWKAAENDVHTEVKDDAVLMMDVQRGVLMVGGRADDMKRLENIVWKAMERGPSVLLIEPITPSMSPDLLSMLVESTSGSDESDFSLEVLWESGRAVVTFKNPKDAEQMLSVSVSHSKLLKHGLRVEAVEAADSVRVEGLPSHFSTDVLEMYCEKHWTHPLNIKLFPEEEAAIVTFSDSKVVESICVKKDHMMLSVPIRIYPYHRSLETALYGAERPQWKLPAPITDKVHHVVWEYLQKKKLLGSINEQMRPHFCSVDLEEPEAKLRPLPGLLRQKNVTTQLIEAWPEDAQKAFRQVMSQFSIFECLTNEMTWKAAENDVHMEVKDAAVLMMDVQRGILVVGGRADDIKRLKAPVENIVQKAMYKHLTPTSSDISLTPDWFFILKLEGLLKAADEISHEMKVSYDEEARILTITGLPAEISNAKVLISEQQIKILKKQLNFAPCLLDFLGKVDPMDMYQDLFKSQGITATFRVEGREVVLVWSPDQALADAEKKMNLALSVHTLDVEDKNLLKFKEWGDLNQELLDSYNTAKEKSVKIQTNPERSKVCVAGFMDPVEKVSGLLRDFLFDYAHVQESLSLRSLAVTQFIEKTKSQDWISITKNKNVSVHLDQRRPRILLTGPRLHINETKSWFIDVIDVLFTDTLTIDIPGAKKYFESIGRMFLSTMITDLKCVVLLKSKIQGEEDLDSSMVQHGSGAVMAPHLKAGSEGIKASCGLPQTSEGSGPSSHWEEQQYEEEKSEEEEKEEEMSDEEEEKWSDEEKEEMSDEEEEKWSDEEKEEMSDEEEEEMSDEEEEKGSEEEKQEMSDEEEEEEEVISKLHEAPAPPSLVSSPSLGVYQMKIHQLTLEVSSGDITKESADAIVNSSDPGFTQRRGVSKAILDGAGPMVPMEISEIVKSPNYQPSGMIATSAGNLPSSNIIHVHVPSDPPKIKDAVYSVLKLCEENHFCSVSFPALGTGAGGVKPSEVADAMVEAVVEFEKKKKPQNVQSVKILIFQTSMISEFHQSMLRKQQDVEKQSKSLVQRTTDWFKDTFSSILPKTSNVVKTVEFEPTVFELCAEDKTAVGLAKKRIEDLILAEQAERTISDPFIRLLSPSDWDRLSAMQRKLTVSIRLDPEQEDQEPRMHLRGLTRDVFTAESEVRDILLRLERAHTQRKK